MSCDLAVWFPNKRLSGKEAQNLYVRLCEGDLSGVLPHPAVDSFYEELTSKHPEIDSVPENRIDDVDHCPWSCAFDRSPAHVIMACVWSKADYVTQLVNELAKKHGLACYDPQAGIIHYPDGNQGRKERKSVRRSQGLAAIFAGATWVWAVNLSQTSDRYLRFGGYALVAWGMIEYSIDRRKASALRRANTDGHDAGE